MVAGGMDRLALAVDRLDRLTISLRHLVSNGRAGRSPRPSGRRPASRARATRAASGASGSTARRASSRTGRTATTLPRYSPVDGRLAFTSDRNTKGKADLFILDDGAVRPLGDIPGTVEDLRWTSDGAAIVVLAADRGLDGGATNGAEAPVLGRRGGPGGRQSEGRAAAAVQGRCSPTARRRRSVPPTSASGSSTCSATTPRSRSSRTIRASAAGTTRASSGSTSRRARATVLHRSDWQLQCACRRRLRASASPSSKAGRATAAWSRARSASSISRPASCRRSRPPRPSDVTTFQWRDEESLWFAGWSKLGAIYGVVGLDGTVVWSRYEDAIIGTEQLLRADLAGARQDRLRRGARDGRRAARDRLQGDVRRGLEAGHAG